MNKGERIFSAVFGALLFAVGVFALAQDHLSPALRVAGGLALILLGGNSMFAAYSGKASWLSRIGPLP